MEEGIPGKWKSKEAGVEILISDKVDFKPEAITKDREGNYKMI